MDTVENITAEVRLINMHLVPSFAVLTIIVRVRDMEVAEIFCRCTLLVLRLLFQL